jgi:hypothetical protein
MTIQTVSSVWKVVVSEMVLGMGIEERSVCFGKRPLSHRRAEVSYV